MPRGSRFKKPADGSVFGKIIEKSIEDASHLLNAIDFIETPSGLHTRLYPLQRLTVKCIFAVPLDYKPIKIPMWDVFREKLIRAVTEEECLHILHRFGLKGLEGLRLVRRRPVQRRSCGGLETVRSGSFIRRRRWLAGGVPTHFPCSVRGPSRNSFGH